LLFLNGPLISLGDIRDIFFEGAESDELSIKLTMDNEECRWEYSYPSLRHDSDVLISPTEQRMPKSFFQCNLLTGGFHYLHAERLGPKNFVEQKTYFTLRDTQLGNYGEHTASLMISDSDKPIQNKSIINLNAKSNTLRDQVEAWMGELCPGIRLAFSEQSDLDVISQKFYFSLGKDVSNTYRATNVGYGITFVLPVILALLIASPGDLLILENPEGHLHPKAQAILGRLIALAANSGVQIILETHSDHILNSMRVAVKKKILSPEKIKIHFFTRKVENNKHYCSKISPQISQDGKLDIWPEDFFDTYDKDLCALLNPIEP
jgi:predicted ATPase